MIKKDRKDHGRRKKIIKRTFAVIIFLVFLPAALGLFVSFFTKLALLDVFFSLAPTSNLLAETNVLILGIDATQGVRRSDTVMVAHINPLEKEVKIVSIPRDTLVNIPGIGLDKINHAYAYGGTSLARKTVSKFLNISIPYYVVINVSNLEKVINKLGGIKLNVEKRMYYVDYAGGLYVDLYPGVQVLDGKKALGYLRFRADSEGDLGRIKRQQKFMQELSRQLLKGGNIARSPGLIFEVFSNVDTNLNVREVIGLYMGMKQALDFKRVAMTSLPGNDYVIDGIYYWKPDSAALKRLRLDFLNKKMHDVRGNIGKKEKKTS